MRLLRPRGALVSLAFLLLAPPAAAPPLAAQQATGTIQGRVLTAITLPDTAGAPIIGARVTIEGTAFTTVTGPDGSYRFSRVPVGVYGLRAVYVGHRPFRHDSVRVAAGDTVIRDFRLEPTPVQVTDITVVTGTNPLVPRDQVAVRTPFGVAVNGFENAAITTGAASAEFGNAQAAIVAGGGGRLPVDRLSAVRSGQPGSTYVDGVPEPPNTEGYDRIRDNPFVAAILHPLSTFAADVDRAAYGNVRRFITQGMKPPKDAVRVEELINYFPYDYPAPRAGGLHPFTITTEVGRAPWAPAHRLVRIGLRTRPVPVDEVPPSNLVFLVDVSGSMNDPAKLPLVQRSLALLVGQLRAVDRIAMVVYAGSAGLVLPPTSGAWKEEILLALGRLQAGGSTAGGAGLRLAYRVARDGFVAGGTNRVILATDGDFNVGLSSNAEMERLVEEERRSGVFLTVLGFGMGNYKDDRLERLADKGNGNYAYVDDLMEARKTLVHEFGATLHTVAKDVKLQVEFNPDRVQGYRLIGYENRLLAAQDFNDDTKDAGELGAGHTVTALYEVVPTGVAPSVVIRGADTLRYQTPSRATGRGGDELLFVKVRYKAPDGEVSRLLSRAVIDRVTAPSTDFRFASAVAAFGMVLRESEYRGNATTEDALRLARGALGRDAAGYRAGFVAMVEAYQRLGTTLGRR